MISEKELEKIFAGEIKKAGGRAYKFTSPGNDGVPDRIVLLPDGKIIFVELKTDTGRLTRLQSVQCKRIASLGQEVNVLHGLSEIGDFFWRIGLDEAAANIDKIAARVEVKQ